MTGQLSDFLAAHAERVADVMRRTGAEQESRSSANGDRGPRQFINAVLVALTADDLRPLTAFFELGGEKPAGHRPAPRDRARRDWRRCAAPRSRSPPTR